MFHTCEKLVHRMILMPMRYDEDKMRKEKGEKEKGERLLEEEEQWERRKARALAAVRPGADPAVSPGARSASAQLAAARAPPAAPARASVLLAAGRAPPAAPARASVPLAAVQAPPAAVVHASALARYASVPGASAEPRPAAEHSVSVRIPADCLAEASRGNLHAEAATTNASVPPASRVTCLSAKRGHRA